MKVEETQRLCFGIRAGDHTAHLVSVALTGTKVSVFAPGGRSLPMRLGGGRS